MKSNYLKKALVALSMLTVGGSAFGYSWPMVNLTSRPLLIRVDLVAEYEDGYYNIVKAGERGDWSWNLGSASSGHCISKITIAYLDASWETRLVNDMVSWIEQTNTDPKERATKLAQVKNKKIKDINQDILQRFKDSEQARHAFTSYPLRERQIVWLTDQSWGMFDERVNKAAQNLANGIATSTEQAFKLAGVDLGGLVSGLAATTGSLMELLARSKCMSRDFDIVEEQDGVIKLYTKE